MKTAQDSQLVYLQKKSSHNYFNHNDEVNALTFSPDLEILVTGSDDGGIRIFNNVSQQFVCLLPHKRGAIRCVAITDNSKFVASGSQDKLVKIYFVREAQLVHTLPGHVKSVECVCFTHSGDRLLSGSWDRSIIMWSVETGEMLDRFNVHGSMVQCLHIAQDDSILASGSNDHSIALLPLNGSLDFYQRGQELSRRYKSKAHFSTHPATGVVLLMGHKANVRTLAFSHSADRLVSGGWDRRVVVWNLTTLQIVHQLVGAGGWIQSVQWSADDTHIVAASDHDSLIVWDSYTGHSLWKHEIEGDMTSLFVTMVTPDKIILAGSDFVSDFLPLPALEDDKTGEDFDVVD